MREVNPAEILTAYRNGWSLTELARRYQLTVAQVHEMVARAKLTPATAQPRRRRREWTPAMLADLPVLCNNAFERKHHISWRLLTAKRLELGLPTPPAPKKQGPRFTDRMIELLGQRTDKKLARNFKLNPWQVAAKRHQLGIPSYRETHKRIWTPEALAQLGRVSDPRLASQLGLSASAVRIKRIAVGIPSSMGARKASWRSQIAGVLGKMKDADAAIRLGVSIHSVRALRTKLGIPQYGITVWTPKMTSLLGTATDKEVARKLRVPAKAVKLKRIRMRIPSVRRRPGPPCSSV